MSLTRITGAKDLAHLRHRAETAVDAKADEVRRRFVTPNKDATYLEKREEAREYLRLSRQGRAPQGAALAEDFPYLAEEAGRTAPDAESLATLWLARNEAWRRAGAKIEGVCVAGKAAARAGRSKAEIDAAVAAAVAALDGIGTKPPAPPDAQSHWNRRPWPKAPA